METECWLQLALSSYHHVMSIRFAYLSRSCSQSCLCLPRVCLDHIPIHFLQYIQHSLSFSCSARSLPAVHACRNQQSSPLLEGTILRRPACCFRGICPRQVNRCRPGLDLRSSESPSCTCGHSPLCTDVIPDLSDPHLSAIACLRARLRY